MEELSIYKIILTVISFYFIIDRLLRFARKESRQSLFKFATTILIWLSILFITLFPELTRITLEHLGIKKDLEGEMIISFTIVFLIIFRLLSVIEKLEKNMTDIVREIALKDIKSRSISSHKVDKVNKNT